MYALDCLLLIAWTTASFAVGMFWYYKGRSLPAGFWLSMVLTPPVGLAVGALVALDPIRRSQHLAPGGRLRYCPLCHELMPQVARICPSCVRGVDGPAAPAAAFAGGTCAPAQFDVSLLRDVRQPCWLVRELDPVAVSLAATRPHLVRNPAIKTMLESAFPLDLALYVALQRRQREGPRSAPVRVRFLDGTVEELG